MTTVAAKDPWEFYETPVAFTRYLFWEMARMGIPIEGTCYEPTVGNGAIVDASYVPRRPARPPKVWITNDLDKYWTDADFHHDARRFTVPHRVVDWAVGNPPFSAALPIIERCLGFAKVGVAMHLRASIHEVLKGGVRRTWMVDHQPTGILWLPRFAYQRSPTTGKWTTDSVCACWVVWVKDQGVGQFIHYAPEWVLDELKQDEREYRQIMDRLMAKRGKRV